jgi:hypothetical protein
VSVLNGIQFQYHEPEMGSSVHQITGTPGRVVSVGDFRGGSNEHRQPQPVPVRHPEGSG